MSDLASAPVYYAGIPFVELASASSAADFADQTSGAAAGVAQAQLANELGCSLSREFGSRWQDLVLPSAIAVAFRRELAREGDQVTDAAVWEASGKWASVNLFGQLGAYPSSLPFDSDEYAAMLKASIASPRGGGAVKASIQSQFLATLYAGAADRLDFDNRFALDSGPGSGSWSESAKVTLSKRVKRHFLLDLYRLILPADAAERAKPAGESARASVASRYLEVLAGTEPVARSVLTFSGEIDGLSGDASGRRLGWKASESYEARVTVPELATLKASASLSQALDAASGTLSLGFELSLGATISF
jgi:hypothetical protein